MRLMIIIMFFSLIYLVSGKSKLKTLTESMGQEVIEIGTPIKELPMGVEEEPSSGEDYDDKTSLKTTGNTKMPATKTNEKKTTVLASFKKDVKDVETKYQDEDEARLEKELDEIYKDTADYKADSSEEKEKAKETPVTAAEKETTIKEETMTEAGTTTEEETSAEEFDKPIGRQRSKFQPDSTDLASVEKFRTSVDEINCNNRQKLSGTITDPVTETGTTSSPSQTTSKEAFRTVGNGIILITAMLTYVFICT